GLNHLHSIDIVHTDIKPANILISGDGRCLIGDYGACQLERCSRRNPAELITSIGFAAPETKFTQIGGFVQFDERSDFWSLGMTIYALTTDCS
ncbi:kinase-like domain-containing protein, partial [Mycena polygramma]